jgi:hypothetical protein
MSADEFPQKVLRVKVGCIHGEPSQFIVESKDFLLKEAVLFRHHDASTVQ